MIPCVESQYTQEYIANALWRQRIAKVSNITLIPYIRNLEVYSIAYIGINEWCDSEAAYNFIQRLKNPEGEARLVHHGDDWWPIQLNTHNDGNINVGSYTVKFDSAYFKRAEPQTPSGHEEEKLLEPIKGLRGEYYSVAEALARVWDLAAKLDYNCHIDCEESREICHLENELRIHESLNRSQNVTLRAYQLGKRNFDGEFNGVEAERNHEMFV